MNYGCTRLQSVRNGETRKCSADSTGSSSRAASGLALVGLVQISSSLSHHAAEQRRRTDQSYARQVCSALIATLLQFLKQLQDLFDARKSSGSVFLTEKRCRSSPSRLSTWIQLLTYSVRCGHMHAEQSPTSQQRRQQEQKETSRWARRAAAVAGVRRAREQRSKQRRSTRSTRVS
jgi:hypothetical protein